MTALRIVGRVLVIAARLVWWLLRLALAMVAGAIAAGAMFVRSDRKRRGHQAARTGQRRMPRASGRQDYDRTYLRSQTRRVSRR